MLSSIFDMFFSAVSAAVSWIEDIGSSLSWNIWNFVIACIIISAIYRLILVPLLGAGGSILGGNSDAVSPQRIQVKRERAAADKLKAKRDYYMYR